MLSDQKNAFHRKGGMFSNALNKKMYFNNKQDNKPIENENSTLTSKKYKEGKNTELEMYSNRFRIMEENFFYSILNRQSENKLKLLSKNN
jgi:hypothetical protein